MGLEVNRVKYKKEWPLVRLKEVCNRISDGTHFTPEYVKEGIPFISVKDVYESQVHFDKCKFITVEAHKELIKRCHPEKDDILITKSGTIGRMALVPEKPEFSLFVSVALIKNKKEVISSKFLKLCLENFLNSINISQDIKGGLLKNFHLEDIRGTFVPIVSIDEQTSIVSKLEELFSELDKSIETLRLAQQQLKTYRQAILKWAFEGKFTEEWRKENGTSVRIQSGSPETYMVSSRVEPELLAAEPFTEYHSANNNLKDGELPEGWKWEKLGGVCTSVEYGSATKSKEAGKIPVLRMGNIQKGKFDWEDLVYTDDDTEIEKYFLKKNDVLFNRTNSSELVGKTAVYKGEKPAIFAGYLIRINRIESLIDADYLTYYLNTHAAKQYGNTVRSFGVNQSNINGTKLKTYPIPITSLQEQKQIVFEIENRFSIADNMEESMTQSLQRAEALRQSILKRSFEGKLNS